MNDPALAATGLGGVAIAVTVVATVVVVALAVALGAALRAARQLRAAALALDAEARALLSAVDGTVAHASAELARVDDLIGSAEQLSDTVGSASRLAYATVAAPLIKVMAISRGTSRASQRLRTRRR